MPKRKRAEPAGSSSPKPAADRALGRRKFNCAKRIDAAQKPLVAALRRADGLERKKHSRRKKTAQANNDEKALARIEAEYSCLKSLDLEKVAGMHLRKTIGKVKSLRESGCMPDNVLEVEKEQQDAALLNVKGRLFKVDGVRQVVDETIDDLKEIVGSHKVDAKVEKNEEAGRSNQTKKARTGNHEDALEQDGEEDSETFAALDALIAAPSSAEDDSEASLSDGHRPLSEEDAESQSEDGDEDDLSDNRDTISDSANTLAFHDFSTDEESDETSDSGTEHDDAVSDSDSPSIPLPKAKRKAADADLAPTKGSTFLPALSHPTYISGSESDASDVDAEVGQRKNRRGQRARQKIWEQKFKDKAKHVLKQERDHGWDAKRGAVGERGGRGGRGGRRGMVGRGPDKSGANEIPLGPPKKTKRDDAGALHPSWQAAKAAKEKKMDIKPMGKKVVFD
ncbi:Bud-site selection protein [Bimuria novae-zelandiae CBS 107.79]|uniref:Bud-site selection protein n=1 Tax=Bimuria novae-zelandiae CBS 107.79 TaxID=1447943 RepID=A0A6A5UYF8_9PLEO|nr:Bud-site selection protein [Bimuria novae-zelandiae CBS 107.79]